MTEATTCRLADEQLDEIVRRLVAALAPQRIHLFGSHVYGTPTRDSDVDLLIVLADSHGQAWSGLYARASECVRDLCLPVELHFRTPSAFRARSAVRASFEHGIRTRGQIVFQSGRSEPDQSDELPYADRIDTEKAKRQIVSEWLAKARRSLRAAEFILALDDPHVGAGCFWCQMAAEQAFRALLQWHERPAPKGRDIGRLVEACARCDPILPGECADAPSLTHYACWESEPVDDASWAAEAPHALATARSVLNVVRRRLRPGSRA